MTEAFPLFWPEHVKRTPSHRRIGGNFQVKPATAFRDLFAEVARSGGTGVVLSSNVPLRRDGLPYANVRESDDPGVAVYFQRKGVDICIPCDTYDRAWKNVRAVSLSIKDMRGPESRGCAMITDQAFKGFAALPPPDSKPWWVAVGVGPDATRDEINAAYRDRARALAAADDQGQLQELNVARDKGLKARA